jgi:hypothetical protein
MKNEKKCKQCSKVKPIIEFWSDYKKDYRGICAGCIVAARTKARTKAARAGSPQDIKAKVQAYKLDCTQFQLKK